MLPRVVSLKRLDVHRDGGSISASFEGDEKNTYCLFFPINLNFKTSLETESLGYKSPILEKYTNIEYKSPITGVSSPDSKKESIPISWNQARSLLEELRPHLDGFASDYIWVFGEMLNAAENHGRK